jgi:hypothetical protein
VVGEVRFNEATASSVQYLMHLSNGTGDDAIMVSRRNSGGYANKLPTISKLTSTAWATEPQTLA